jgi:Right handed beta helix region
MARFVTAILALVSLATPALAADYFLDGAAGNDTRDGRSAAASWKTLDHANRQVFQPGDRLLLKAGTSFAGQLKPQGSGTAAAPIRIDRYSEGPKPQIAGGGVMPASLYLYNIEYWEVRNLDISNKGPSRQAKRCGVYIQAEDFGTAHHIVLDGLDVHDVNGSLVKKEGAGYGILWENSGSEKKSRFDDLLIENCTVRRCERNGILGWSGYWHRSNWYPSLHVVIRNNLIEQVPGDGIVPIGCDGPLVEYNVMRDCPRLLPDTEAAAGIWPWSCDNAVIQFNEVSDHKSPWDAQGFDSDWNCRNTIIQYNYSHDNEGGFLLVCTNGEIGEPDNVGNVGTIVRYNVSINDGLRSTGKHAGVSPAFYISGPVKDTKIYNNLVYVNRKPAGVDHNLLKMDNWGGPWPIDTWFANNIFTTEEWAGYDYGKAVNTIFLNNLYAGEHRNGPQDAKAIRADPQFLLPGLIRAGIQAVLGYRLQPGSPARGAGLPIPENGGRDFLGQLLPKQGAPAVGPFE